MKTNAIATLFARSDCNGCPGLHAQSRNTVSDSLHQTFRAGKKAYGCCATLRDGVQGFMMHARMA